MEKKYFGMWENKEEIIRDFDLSSDIHDIDIICAAYVSDKIGMSMTDYYKYAFVLFKGDGILYDKGKLYEVNCNHLSLYELDCWEPEYTTKETLLKRDCSYNIIWKFYGKELNEIIRKL